MRNDWPQNITEKWCKATGVRGPWASQISQLVNGSIDPRVQFFMALGEFNRAVAERDLAQLSKETAVYNMLVTGQPFKWDDGSPVDATGFFQLFCGIREIPEEYKAEAIPGASVEELFGLMDEAINAAALAAMRPKPELLKELDAEVIARAFPLAMADTIRKALLGIEMPNLAKLDLERLRAGLADCSCLTYLAERVVPQEDQKTQAKVKQLHDEIASRALLLSV